MPPATTDTADACIYLLHMLLQRLDPQQPGLVAELLAGAQADRAAVLTSNPDQPLSIFDTAIQILERIQAQHRLTQP